MVFVGLQPIMTHLTVPALLSWQFTPPGWGCCRKTGWRCSGGAAYASMITPSCERSHKGVVCLAQARYNKMRQGGDGHG